jgi:hypothetical protein
MTLDRGSSSPVVPARRFGDVPAFVIGASVGCVMVGLSGNQLGLWTLPLVFLCPGFFVALPALGLLEVGLFTPGFFLSILLATAVFNGVIYGLAWHLTRLAVEGRRPLLVPVVLGAGLWISWFVNWTVENWPKPEPPPAPVDLTSPLAGRWVGVIHGHTREVPVTLILHPRIDGTLDGFQCNSREYVERFDEGTYAGDSLRYEIMGFQQRGRRDGTTMTIESSVGGTKQMWELRFVSADTGRAGLPDSVAGP